MTNTILNQALHSISRHLPRLFITAGFSILAVIAQAGSANADTITIVNNRADAVAVCVYRNHIELGRNNAIACWVLEPKKSVTWNRGKESFIYSLSLSKPNTNNTFCKRAGVPIGAVLTIGSGAGCNIDVSSPKPAPPPSPKPKPKPTPNPELNWIGIGNEWPEKIRVCMATKSPLPECLDIEPLKRIVWYRKGDTSNYDVMVNIDYNRVVCERKNLSGGRELWTRELVIQRPCKVAKWGEPRPPQGNSVMIFNNRQETVKVCMYDPSYAVDSIALACWTINSKAHIVWNRKTDRSMVRMRMFTPGLFDTAICTPGREIKGLPEAIDIWQNCDVNYYFRPKFPDPRPLPAPGTENDPPKYFLKVCNLSDWGTVKFALAYAVDKEFFGDDMDYQIAAEGWWKLPQGECNEIEMGERMRKNRDPARPPGSVQPLFYIYGESLGVFSKVWEGEDENTSYCLNVKNDFLIRQWTLRRRECVGSSYDRLQMIPVPHIGKPVLANTYYFAWNFE